jgi:sugar/nucleoside kinase (ribokinase family)
MLIYPPPELLVVGGLTVDRFADGRSPAPGGSVLHATHAMHLDGRRTIVVTLAGLEAVAQRALDRLRSLAEVHAQRAARTIGFEHDETADRRHLTFVASAGTLALPALTVRPRAVLYAPVADELDAGLGWQRYEGAVTGAILQGWLRQLAPGSAAAPVPLGHLDPALVDALAACDLLVASVDDLAAEADEPRAQLDALRRTFGARPALAVTDGVDGAWLSAPDGVTMHIAAGRRIDSVSSVGAGDAFAAALLTGMSRGVPLALAAHDAANLVSEVLAERTGRRLLIVGDVHGMLDALLAALRGHGLVDAAGRWIGGHDELWLAGDLVDRGPEGLGVVELVMRLQDEAASAGGRVGSVLGNHEIQLMAASAFPGAASSPDGRRGFHADWLANGGRPDELARLRAEHVAWMRDLPVAARVGAALLVHSDALLHRGLGPSVAGANATVRAALARPDDAAWDRILAVFSGRRAFLDAGGAAELLEAWGGREVVHGHTPLSRLFGRMPAAPEAVRYAGGRAVAVDGGAYGGGSLIVHRIPPA